MRFGAEMTQSEIGAELGVSQMHVSRILARILKTLRAGMSLDHRAGQGIHDDHPLTLPSLISSLVRST